MAKRKSNKVDPKKTWASYVLDLRKDFQWAGELSFAARREGPKKYYDYEVKSLATIEITAPLVYTDSKKIDVGIPIELTISIKPEVKDDEFVGLLSKYGEGMAIYIWMPWDDAMFFHQILMSGRCEMLEVFGTDLYRRSGWVRRISLNRQHDVEEVSIQETT